ncbi:MAG: glutathione S-transferase C-terminal domain-containing protein, partial [Polyangiaceae bacterium]
GAFDTMITSMESAIAGKQFVLGDKFSMADCVFGGTVRFMLQFKMIEGTPALKEYAARLAERPAAKRADARNMAIAKEHGLGG